MKKNLTSLSDFIDQEVGVKGAKKRAKFDKGFDVFKLTVLIKQGIGDVLKISTKFQ